MTCAELDILLCDYVDGTLEGDRKAAVEAHLSQCAACAQLARDASAAVAFMRKAERVEPPDELVTRLLFQIPDRRALRDSAGLQGLLSRLLEPVLQPRFAMGMAMTILSFSLLAKFTGIPGRPLQPSDLQPARIIQAIDDRAHRLWDRAVKYYESLRLVYEIQTRLGEWAESEQAVSGAAETETQDPGQPGEERAGP